jgi:hypothetical protein
LAVLGELDGAGLTGFCGCTGWLGGVAGLVGGVVGLGDCGVM